MVDSIDNESDATLVERVRDSDREAFRGLFGKYQPVLFRATFASLRDRDAAHDVVQETFVRVWNYRSSLQPHLPFLALLFRISRNLMKDAAKHAAVRKRSEGEVAGEIRPQPESPEDALRMDMLKERLSAVVRTNLPARCREVFLLSRVEEMTNAEIGTRLGLSVKTVENQITRALKILRRQLRDYLN